MMLRTVTITKTFVAGTLSGLTVEDTLICDDTAESSLQVGQIVDGYMFGSSYKVTGLVVSKTIETQRNGT